MRKFCDRFLDQSVRHVLNAKLPYFFLTKKNIFEYITPEFCCFKPRALYIFKPYSTSKNIISSAWFQWRHASKKKGKEKENKTMDQSDYEDDMPLTPCSSVSSQDSTKSTRVRKDLLVTSEVRARSTRKRKDGLFKKARELASSTNSQVLVAIVSEKGRVYTFATSKLQGLADQALIKKHHECTPML